MNVKKNYLPDLYSRNGWAPDRIRILPTDLSEEEFRRSLEESGERTHFFLPDPKHIIALTPVSHAPHPAGEDGFREIRIHVREQGGDFTAALKHLTELIRIRTQHLYGQPIPINAQTVSDETGTVDPEFLDKFPENDTVPLYRVQTGCYREKRDAEDAQERLRKAGIAGYIVPVSFPEETA